MDINSLTSDDIMSELFKILDRKVRSKPRLTDDQRLLAKKLLQALPPAISSSCPISTTSVPSPLITSQHQEDNAYPRTYTEAVKGEGNNSHTILLYPAVPDPNDSTAGNSNPETKSVRELLSSKLNSTNEKIKIKSYRMIKNKGLAVDYENDEEIQKLMDKIQKSDELKEKIAHKEPKKRRPRCIIYISRRTQPNKRPKRRIPALGSGAPNTSILHSRSSWETSDELEHLQNKRIFQCPPLFLLPELRASPKEL
ncbi:hypothetical protein AVEN_103298-1 [Araneus ventricosus]|uniref:Uncharacterized protein n=1 Tax=Araneus ventricosus TaxID=182803 RepID=A0A4Y2MFP4_ARAVE|nr:hypothetical protein AVEN_103298-1 [Araneus ventricosus]